MQYKVESLKSDLIAYEQKFSTIENENENLSAELHSQNMRLKQLEVDFAESEAKNADQLQLVEEAQNNATNF